jgi:hypothetical protein
MALQGEAKSGPKGDAAGHECPVGCGHKRLSICHIGPKEDELRRYAARPQNGRRLQISHDSVAAGAMMKIGKLLVVSATERNLKTLAARRQRNSKF